MRICDLTNLYIVDGEGGVNTYLREKSAYLGDLGNGTRHVMIVPGAYDDVLRLGRSTVYSIASPRYFRNPQHRILFNRRAVTEILREERPDLVEVDCASLLGQVAARALGEHRPPIVGFYHVHLPTFFAREWGSTFGSAIGSVAEGVSWKLLRYFVKFTDRVVVASRDMYERLRARGFDRLEHIPLGVNTSLFRPGANGHDAAARVGLPGEKPRTILYVGRLSREKHLPVLFRAYERLAERGDFRLRVVGDGPLRPLVEEFASRYPGVEYTGLCPYGDRLARYYQDADVVVIPSPSETFGLTILESLASGVPVVAVRRGGPSGILRPELGALAEPDDASDLAEKIRQVIGSRHSSGVYRQYVLEHFSWERTFDRLLELYRALAASPPRRRAREAPADRRPESAGRA